MKIKISTGVKTKNLPKFYGQEKIKETFFLDIFKDIQAM